MKLALLNSVLISLFPAGVPVSSNVPICPQDDDKTYASPEGIFFMVRCQVHSIADKNMATNETRRTQNGSLQQCIDECSKEPGYLNMDYIARPGKDHVLKQCVLYRVGGSSTPTGPCATKTVDMAYLVDPSEEDVPDVGRVAGSTECPSSNGNVIRGVA
jgi:hypothetical protein